LNKLFLDIETLPANGDQMPIIKDLFEEYKKKNGKNKIPNQVRDDNTSFDSYFRSTSFSGEFGRILCIGYAINDQETKCLVGDEKKMLEDFWQIAKDADQFIGHNVMDFDLRFIYKRSIISGVKPSRDLSFARYRSDPIFDTMKEWEKWGAQGVSLHKLALALDIESSKSDGIDGSKVYDYFLLGKVDDIYKYCKRDVEVTRKIYNRMKFNL